MNDLFSIEDRIVQAAARGAHAAVAEQLRSIVSPDGTLLVSTTEAGRRLGVSESTVRVQLIPAGDLDVVEGVGRGMKVTVESLNRFVAARSVNKRDSHRMRVVS